MMGAHDQAEAGGVMNLCVSQMKQQITGPSIQDVVEGRSDHGHGPRVQPAGERDLLAAADLRHARRQRRHSARCHVQLLA
jgi:hypothetical protein